MEREKITNMKVIFLDIDGVLNSDEYFERTIFVILDDEVFKTFDQTLLKKLIKMSGGVDSNGYSFGE